jgi:hypothetical protein
MRVKSQWFRGGADKTPEEVAGAAAFIAWRVAANALGRMRKAGCDLPAGPRYFGFCAEFLAFLVVGADRIAHRRRDPTWRVAFTTAMANRAGEILAENESELLGASGAGAIKAGFVDRVNAFAADVAVYDWTDGGPDYGLLRYLGHRVAEVLDERDKSWGVSQVIEVEAPEAAETLQRGMAGLLGEAPRARRERA